MLFKYKKLFTKDKLGKNDEEKINNIIDEINNKQIYVPSIENLNDPFEKMFKFNPYESYTENEKKIC